MKRIIVFLVLLPLAFTASAQRVTGQFGAYYQNGPLNEATCHHIGAQLGVSFDPFFPWPFYLETGINAALYGKLKGAPDNQRFEIPLNLTWQWEPSPYFSIGPYGGVNAALNIILEGGKTFFTWGWQAGISIRPSMFYINIAYHKDLLPFAETPDFVKGIRGTIGVCF